MTRPSVTGPVVGGRRGWPFAAANLDVAKYGYVEQELFLEGTATRYRPVGEHGRDGVWSVEAAESAPFKTRALVYRPTDAARFNGTVIVSWNNVTAGHDLFRADSLEIFEGGFALVCVTTQKAGIEGLPPVNQGLAAWDPDRYGTLSIPSDDYSFDVFTQAGRAVGPHRSRHGVDPMGGLDVQRVVALGASQSAARLATYFNAIQPQSRAFDGFMLLIYFGGGSSLNVGDAVVNIAAKDRQGAALSRSKSLLRDDAGVPVFVVNSELEASSCYEVRQPDTDSFRYWEAAGTCHVSRQILEARKLLADRDELVSRRIRDGINTISMEPVFDAAYHHMHRWLTRQGAPPTQPRIDFTGDPPTPLRDAHGIAKGGIRLPQAEVPLERNSALPRAKGVLALLDGSSEPFPPEKVVELYGDRDGFLSKFEAAAQAAVEAGVILPRAAAPLVEEARATFDRSMNAAGRDDDG